MKTHLSAALVLLASIHASASAQLTQASAAALGLGNNMTASARGFAAVANNPAGLAHPASPGFSLAILPIAADLGLGPIAPSDLADYEGQLIPTNIKTEWLDRIATSGSQSGTFGVGVTGLALNAGSIGFQIGVLAGGNMNLPPDAAELLLFGNAGRTGQPRDFTLDGSSLDAFALTTAGLSYGMAVAPGVYVGATGTYTVGNALVVGRDAGSLLSANPLEVDIQFPILGPNSDDAGIEHGSGVGLDVGAIWEAGPGLTLGATVQNVFHTFEWTFDEMSYIPGEAFFDRDTASSDFDEQPASAAPVALLDLAAEHTIKPILAVGAEFRPGPLVKVQADLRKRVSGGLEIGPEFHAGVGVELGLLGFLPLRAHAAAVTGGLQVGGGASLILGPVNLSGAGAYRSGDQDTVLAMFTLSFGAN
ncbi:MAG: DUF5723 family protein [Gemmatimonadota bacterium]